MSQGVIRAWRLSKARYAGDLWSAQLPLVLSRHDVPDGPGQQLGLVLPSVVVSQVRNLLLNPLHPAMAAVTQVHQEPFQLDQRLG